MALLRALHKRILKAQGRHSFCAFLSRRNRHGLSEATETNSKAAAKAENAKAAESKEDLCMTPKQQIVISKKLQSIVSDLNKEKDPRAAQAQKLIYCAEKILSQKDLITIGQKAGE
jgi:hypothetical protein